MASFPKGWVIIPKFKTQKGATIEVDLETKELITCADCVCWDANDGTFKDVDGMQWHNCPLLGIETDESFFCKLGIRKGKKND
jgi:hypothetical protein